MNEIQKPMSVARNEFIGQLATLVRNCQLPPFVIEPILRDLLKEIQMLQKRQEEEEYRVYQEQFKHEEN